MQIAHGGESNLPEITAEMGLTYAMPLLFTLAFRWERSSYDLICTKSNKIAVAC